MRIDLELAAIGSRVVEGDNQLAQPAAIDELKRAEIEADAISRLPERPEASSQQAGHGQIEFATHDQAHPVGVTEYLAHLELDASLERPRHRGSPERTAMPP
jgi:hypothetical protein